MKFRTLFLIILIGFCISACASPSTIGDPDGSTELQDLEEGDPDLGEIDSLIGTINDGIDEDSAAEPSSEDVEKKNDDNLTADDCAKDPNAEMDGNKCVCADRHFRVGDEELCKQTCDDPKAKASRHGCGSCKTGYVKNDQDRCVEPSGITITSDAENEEFVIGGEVEQLSYNFTATGGSGSFKWSVTGLPEGMEQDKTTATLTISGTPTELGTFPITVTVKDIRDLVEAVTKSFELTVTHKPTIAVEEGDISFASGVGTLTLDADKCEDNAYSLKVANGITDYTWSIDDNSTTLCLSSNGSSCTEPSSNLTTNGTEELYVIVNPCGTGNDNTPAMLEKGARASIIAKTTESISESDQIALNITFKQPPEFFVHKFAVTIKTGDHKYSGTDSLIKFSVKGGAESATTWTEFDNKSMNDFERDDEYAYSHVPTNPINVKDIDAFTLSHDGTKKKSGWLIEGIHIKADIIDESGNIVEEQVFYHNPCVLKWVDSQNITFSANDVAICAIVSTDIERDGDDIGSGTDNDVLLEIALDNITTQEWGEFHPEHMGPFLEKKHSGLDLNLDWPEYNDHEKGDTEYYADHVSSEGIRVIDVESAQLKLGEGNDSWRSRGFEAYIFKPARVFTRGHGETACWYIDGRVNNGEVLSSGDRANTHYAETSDCERLMDASESSDLF